jgi:hypothetical protein
MLLDVRSGPKARKRGAVASWATPVCSTVQAMPRAPLALLAALAIPHALLGAQNGSWLNRGPVPGLASCSGELFVYDGVRHESVWFRRTTCHETWIWNGATWTQRATTAAPPTWSTAAAYDSVRNVVVALSGNQSTGMETWEWNGERLATAPAGWLTWAPQLQPRVRRGS